MFLYFSVPQPQNLAQKFILVQKVFISPYFTSGYYFIMIRMHIKDIANLVFHLCTTLKISNAEKFLLKCLAPKSKAHNFDQYRYETYHRDLQFNIEKFPPTSNSIEQHIKRAYFQCHLWLHAPFVKDISTDPVTYGYTLDKCELLIPFTLGQLQNLDDFPSPCTCAKCVRENACPCRMKNIVCCEFCKCKAEPQCKNSNNP